MVSPAPLGLALGSIKQVTSLSGQGRVSPGNDKPDLVASEEVRKQLRDELVKLFALSVPAFVVQQLLLISTGWITHEPWKCAIFLLPIIAVSIGIFWWLFRKDNSLVLRRKGLVLFCLYCLFFTIAAETEVLSWRRKLIGYEEYTPSGFLGLSRFGDWRYGLFGEAPEARDLLVVTLPTVGRTREKVRYDIFRLIKMAAASDARGLALDLRLVEPSGIDPLLCEALRNSSAQSMPIFVGYGHRESPSGLVSREDLSPSLDKCVPAERLGHIAGYQEMDRRVRMIPIYLVGNGRLEALSLRIASFLTETPSKTLSRPENNLLQPLRPHGGLLIVPWGNLEGDKNFRDVLRDHFVFVGSSAKADRHDTPYRSVPGVVIHAWATQALRTGEWVLRVSPRWLFPGIWLLCYVLLVVWVQGASPRRLLGYTAVLSLIVIVGVALAATCKVWIDASYPLAAIWPLAGTLAIYRRWRAPVSPVSSAG